jgi:hypothetical protein
MENGNQYLGTSLKNWFINKAYKVFPSMSRWRLQEIVNKLVSVLHWKALEVNKDGNKGSPI